MNKFLVCVAFLTIIALDNCYSQNLNDIVKSNSIYNIPQERVFVHYNTSLLFVGEYLYYSIYCFNLKNKKLTTNSKIAYLELVGKDKKVVFKHKINLSNGKGQGDFFIPTSVPSGHYKIVAYTQWMKNEERPIFFQDNINIINPYQSKQTAILASKQDSTSMKGKFNPIDFENNSSEEQKRIRIRVSAKKLAKREKVTLILQHTDSLLKGNYSISVRLIDTITIAKQQTAASFFERTLLEYKPTKYKKNTLILPEMRGELISGKIIPKKKGLPIAEKKIGFSIPGENYILKIATTNTHGTFYINLEEDYESENALTQVLDEQENYSIELNKHQSFNYDSLVFDTSFRITQKMKKMIKERSVFNQISAVFFLETPDTLINKKPRPPFYGSKFNEYVLDDFTRFPTVKETTVEIIPSLSVKKNIENQDQFIVKSTQEEFENLNELLPLILIDGVLIQNHKLLLDCDARIIEKIIVVRNNYFLGTKIYQGIIDVKTKNHNFFKNLSDSSVNTVKLFKPQPLKKYFTQKYSNSTKDKSNHLPDYRYQLLWNPDLNLNTSERQIEFFTSDIAGDYEISIEGFTETGKPVSLNEIITVK